MGRTQNLILSLFWIILIASCKAMDYNNTCLMPGTTIDMLIDVRSDWNNFYQCCPGYAGPVGNCLPVCSMNCGPNAFCNSPEHCACIDNDYEKIEGGTGCKPKMNRNLCVDKDAANQYSWLQFRSNRQKLPMVCCDGYERLNESEPCLRKVDEHECTELIQVWDQQTLDPNGISRITTTQLQRVCCEGYKRQTSNGPCLPQSEITDADSSVRSTSKPSIAKNDQTAKPNKETESLHKNSDSSAEYATEVDDMDESDIKKSLTLDDLMKMYKDLNLTADSDFNFLAEDNEYTTIKKTVLLKPTPLNQITTKLPKGTNMDAEVSTPKNSKEVERVAELSKDLPTDCLDTDTEEDESATDPNLCSREVEYDSTLSPEWMKIKNAFDDFNLTFPIDLFSKKIETFCCPGYAKNDREKLCKPVCEPNCGANSDCQAPNKCVCRKGFVQTFGSDLCVPECSEQNKPEHSTCITPYMWECDLGYAKVQKAKGENGFECRPHCVHSCSIYGKCVAPNVCECLPGYESILIGYDADNRMALKNCNLIKG